MLSENAGALAASLAAVEGSTEWGVKVFLEVAPTPAKAPPGGGGEDQAPTSGAGYLASRQRERRAAHERDEVGQECAEEVHEAMTRLARQARLNPVQRPEAHGRQAEMILNGAYLVDQERVDELSRSAALLNERWSPQGLAVELTGPWPPYNFVSESAGMIS
jgi:hypothetical protein